MLTKTADVDGLEQAKAGARPHGLNEHALAGDRGNDDKGGGAIGRKIQISRRAKHTDAVHFGQPYVNDHDIGMGAR